MRSIVQILGQKLLFLGMVIPIGLSAQEMQINYLDTAPPPSDSLVIFAPGIVSLPNRWEEKIGFTADGKEVFFGVHCDASIGPNGTYFDPKLMHAIFSNGKWSKPEIVRLWPQRTVAWPLLSQNGNTLFLEEVVSRTENGAIGQVVYTKKENGSWSDLNAFVPQVTSKEGFGLGQMTKDSTLYFHDRFDRIAYFSKWENGKWSDPTQLSYKINPCVEFFVSPQNDYIIFKPLNWSNQFHISFKKLQGEWSMPVPLSSYFAPKKGWDTRKGYGPYVSPDGKYFFLGHKGDIYWVKTDFIAMLRKETE